MSSNLGIAGEGINFCCPSLKGMLAIQNHFGVLFVLTDLQKSFCIFFSSVEC